MIRAKSGDVLEHTSQAELQREVHESLIETLNLISLIDALADTHAEKVLPFSGDMVTAKKQAQRWIIEAITEHLAAHVDCEIVFIQY